MKSLLLVLFAVPVLAFAQEGNSTEHSGEYYSAHGEGKTLPDGVMRFRLPFRFIKGGEAYDNAGKLQKLPVDINVTAGAVVLEYGLSDRVSLQMKTDIYYSQTVQAKSEADAGATDLYKAAKSAETASQQSKALSAVAAGLASDGQACTTTDGCLTLLKSGFNIPADKTLDNGLTIKAGKDWKTTIDAAVQAQVDAAFYAGFKDKVKQSGKSGIGDTDIGALYAITTEKEFPIAISLGAGFRLPTGTFDVKSTELPTGGGVTNFGFRWNTDYEAAPGLFLCWQHQWEFMLNKGTHKNDAGSTVNYERAGPTSKGFLRVNWGLGDLSQSLKVAGLYGSYNYDIESREYNDGVSQGSPERKMTATVGGIVDGLAYQIPAQLELEYEMPISGRNGAKALNTLGVTLKAFYKF